MHHKTLIETTLGRSAVGRTVLLIGFSLAATLAVACVKPSNVIVMRVAFNPAEMEPWSGPRTATVTGHATYEAGVPGTTVVQQYPAQNVVMYPALQYFHEYCNLTAISTATVVPPMPDEAKRYVMRVLCDPQGNFTITDVPAGHYYILAYSLYPGLGLVQGSSLAEVTVGTGETVRVTVSRESARAMAK